MWVRAVSARWPARAVPDRWPTDSRIFVTAQHRQRVQHLGGRIAFFALRLKDRQRLLQQFFCLRVLARIDQDRTEAIECVRIFRMRFAQGLPFAGPPPRAAVVRLPRRDLRRQGTTPVHRRTPATAGLIRIEQLLTQRQRFAEM